MSTPVGIALAAIFAICTCVSPAWHAVSPTDTGKPIKFKISSTVRNRPSSVIQWPPVAALVLVRHGTWPSMHVGSQRPLLMPTAQSSVDGLPSRSAMIFLALSSFRPCSEPGRSFELARARPPHKNLFNGTGARFFSFGQGKP